MIQLSNPSRNECSCLESVGLWVVRGASTFGPNSKCSSWSTWLNLTDEPSVFVAAWLCVVVKFSKHQNPWVRMNCMKCGCGLQQRHGCATLQASEKRSCWLIVQNNRRWWMSLKGSKSEFVLLKLTDLSDWYLLQHTNISARFSGWCEIGRASYATHPRLVGGLLDLSCSKGSVLACASFLTQKSLWTTGLMSTNGLATWCQVLPDETPDSVPDKTP